MKNTGNREAGGREKKKQVPFFGKRRRSDDPFSLEEKGWKNFKETNRVFYDPDKISVDKMQASLERTGTFMGIAGEPVLYGFALFLTSQSS